MGLQKTFGLGLCWAIFLLPSLVLADTSYTFSMDTSSLNGQQGYIELQFSEVSFGGSGAYNTNATAVVSGFETDGLLAPGDPYQLTVGGSPEVTGDVSGTLPDAVTLLADGDGATNDYTQEMTFGNYITFYLAFSGQGVTTPIPECDPQQGGTQCSFPGFTIDFFDPTVSYYLFTNDPDPGTGDTAFLLGGVNLNADTTTTPYTNPGPNDGPSDLTIIAGTPEPASSVICLSGLLGIAALALKKRSRARHIG